MNADGTPCILESNQRDQTKQGGSYASELEELTYPEICDLAKGKDGQANKARKMKKLVEAQKRLNQKPEG